MDMKQPTQMWQLIISIFVVLLSCGAGILNQSNKIAKLEEKLSNESVERFNAQIVADKKFDKIDTKIDAIQADTRQILVNLANIVDRK